MAKERKSLKSLRRKTAAKKAGTYVDEGLVLERTWEGLPLNKFKVEVGNQIENNNAEPEESSEGENEANDTGEDENTTPESTTSEEITGLSTRCTRAVIKARQKYFETYLQEYYKSVDQSRKKYQTMLADEAIFKKNWAKRIQQLREKTAEGGFN